MSQQTFDDFRTNSRDQDRAPGLTRTTNYAANLRSLLAGWQKAASARRAFMPSQAVPEAVPPSSNQEAALTCPARQEKLKQLVEDALRIAQSPAPPFDQQPLLPYRYPEIPALKAFLSGNCRLTHRFLPDGTFETVQTSPDGCTRTQTRSSDGKKTAWIADRYGRPVLIQHASPDGSWSVIEINYKDLPNQISPFIASRRVTNSSDYMPGST